MSVNDSLYKNRFVNPMYNITCAECGISYISPKYARCPEGEPLYWFRTTNGVVHFCGASCASAWRSKNPDVEVVTGPPYLDYADKI